MPVFVKRWIAALWTYLADLDDSERMGIVDMNADERNSLLTVRTEDGNVFETVCRKAAGKEGGLLLRRMSQQQSMKNKYRQRPLLQYNRNGNKSASAGGTF